MSYLLIDICMAFGAIGPAYTCWIKVKSYQIAESAGIAPCGSYLELPENN